MIYTYCLPDATGNKTEHQTESNSVVIVGANGSGKSKLGAWMEQQNMMGIHRIGAQRSLNFRENIPLQNFSQAEDSVFYGNADTNERLRSKKYYRWNDGKEYTTKLLDDFENVLAALIALTNNENAKYVDE